MLTALIASIILISCGGNSNRIKPEITDEMRQQAEQMQQEIVNNDPQKKLMQEITTSYTNEGKEIELTGYLIPGNISVIDELNNVQIPVSQRPEGGHDDLATVVMKYGKKANNIHFLEKFLLKDVEIYDTNGKQLRTTDKVVIKATLAYPAKGPIKKPIFSANTPDAAKNAQMEIYEMKVAQGDGNDYTYVLNVTSITMAE